MSLSVTAKQLSNLVAVLEDDHETVEIAARAVMAEAEAIFEQRAKFVVVGQLVETIADGRLEPDDPRSIKLSLGWYSTEAEARAAAENLCHSMGDGDVYATWWLPVYHNTPAAYRKEIREKHQATAAKSKETYRERLRKQMEKRRDEANQRAIELRALCKCKHERGAHVTQGCVTIHCACEEFREK